MLCKRLITPCEGVDRVKKIMAPLGTHFSRTEIFTSKNAAGGLRPPRAEFEIRVKNVGKRKK